MTSVLDLSIIPESEMREAQIRELRCAVATNQTHKGILNRERVSLKNRAWDNFSAINYRKVPNLNKRSEVWFQIGGHSFASKRK